MVGNQRGMGDEWGMRYDWGMMHQRGCSYVVRVGDQGGMVAEPQ